MQTVYIRHNIASTKQILEQLWQSRRVALHYEDNRSTNPADYKSKAAQRALKRLWRYCRTGAVVGADFRKVHTSSMLVGEIEAGSEIVAMEYSDAATGRSFIYKVVQLRNARDISFDEYPLLAGIQPRQAAITGWPSAEAQLRSIIRQQPRPTAVSSLHPSQLEVICYEYLRKRGELTALLMPIGRNMLNVDIVGLGLHGQRLLAQVTHCTDRKIIERKLQRLKGTITEASLVFFGPETCSFSDSSVTFVAIENVFDQLLGDVNSPQHQMLQAMLK